MAKFVQLFAYAVTYRSKLNEHVQPWALELAFTVGLSLPLRDNFCSTPLRFLFIGVWEGGIDCCLNTVYFCSLVVLAEFTLKSDTDPQCEQNHTFLHAELSTQFFARREAIRAAGTSAFPAHVCSRALSSALSDGNCSVAFKQVKNLQCCS